MKEKYKEIVRSVPNSDCEFKYVEINKGHALPAWDTQRNVLLFVLEGTLKIVLEGKKQVLAGRQFVLLPKDQKWRGTAVHPVRIMLLLFRTVDSVWSKAKVKKLLDACKDPQADEFPVLPVNSAVHVFLNLLVLYTTETDIDKSLYTGKEAELLSLLYIFYKPAELGEMFFPLLRNDSDFKSFVLANYQKVDKASDLAELAGCSLVTLNRKFKEYFNDSAYQWMLKNRAVKIKQRLQTSNMPLSDIAREFGFYSSSELNRFCQTRLGMSAGKVRNLMLSKTGLAE